MRPLRYAVFVALVGGCAYGVDDFVGGVPEGGTSPTGAGTQDAATGSPSGPGVDSGSPGSGPDSSLPDSGSPGDDAGSPGDDSGSQSADSGPDGATHTVDSGPPDAGPRDSGSKADAGSVLDPGLGLPAAGGATCSRIDTNRGCQIDEVCRIATPDAGRCESCGSCNGYGESCQTSSDCDTLFQCWKGQCTIMCRLGSNDCSESACIDVGNGTYGVCSPI